ncbi:MAG: anthrone oxygenase family protein, partial [Candidatus Woesearchaeota archaeon]
GSARSWLLLLTGVSYLVVSFGVTAACNVPRNERLGRLEASTPAAQQYWPRYLREWLLWNHVRTAASVLAAACAAGALAS